MNISNHKIQNWLQNNKFPARVLLSGSGNLLYLAIEIASELQGKSREIIESGIHADTIIFRDDGNSFKIGWSEAAKKAGQSEQENVRGMIDFAHKKPLAPYRIIILENIERVGRDASHAMLKLIEEPAKKVIFIFTTKNHHKLLDTIISRVSIVQIAVEENDFEMSEEVHDFLEDRSIIQKFKIIDQLDKKSRENPSDSMTFREERATNGINARKVKAQRTSGKKINRQIFLDFIEELIAVSRIFPKYQKNLEVLLKTHNAITNNLSPKFSLERLALKI